jgi:chalcone isomerase-like protein
LKLLILNSLIICFAFNGVSFANDERSEVNEDRQFPDNIIVDYNDEQLELNLTGMTIRKKFFMKIYSMAHYLEMSSGVSGFSDSNDKIYENILQQKITKQISMVFLRTLKAEQIQKSLISGIKLNTNEEEYKQILPQLESFIRPITEDVNQSDEFVLRWYSNDTVVSTFQGEQISSIKDRTFARALWSIWFGRHSIVERSALIEQMLTSS